MAEQNNQVARELKKLDEKELDLTSLNVRKLRGKGKDRLHTYIALLEVCGCLICRMLYITFPATNIPM